MYKKNNIAVSVLTIIFGCLLSKWVFAADIGIVRQYQGKLATVNNDGNITASGFEIGSAAETLLLATGHEGNFFTSQNTDATSWGGQLLSDNPGLEYVSMNQHRVRIYDQTDTKIDSFSVSSVGADRIVTVGDVFSDISGQEIVVCRTSSRAAKMQVFSYDESFGEATEELSFHPFPDLITEGKKNGCSDITIAEMDGESKIVATSSGQTLSDAELFVYDTEGNLESSIRLGLSGYQDFTPHLDALDFDGDGSTDELAVFNYPELMIVDLPNQQVVTTLNFDYGHLSYAIGNIDDDIQDEITMLHGKKSNLTFWNGDVKTDLGALYPNARTYRNRHIVVTDLSSFTD